MPCLLFNPWHLRPATERQVLMRTCVLLDCPDILLGRPGGSGSGWNPPTLAAPAARTSFSSREESLSRVNVTPPTPTTTSHPPSFLLGQLYLQVHRLSSFLPSANCSAQRGALAPPAGPRAKQPRYPPPHSLLLLRCTFKENSCCFVRPNSCLLCSCLLASHTHNAL